MSTQPVQPELNVTNAHRVAVIINAAMIGGMVMMAVISEVIAKATPPMPLSEHFGAIRTILYGVGFTSVLLVRYVSGVMKTTRPGENVQQLLLRLLRRTAVTAALCEIPGVLGFVLFIIGGQRADMFILMAMTVGMTWVFFPRVSTWRKDVESVRRYSGQLDPAR